MNNQSRIIVFASGSGTTFEYLTCQPSFQTVLLITDKKQCGAIERAKKQGIPFESICPQDYSSHSLWDQAVVKAVKEFSSDVLSFEQNIDLIVLAGFLRRLGPHFLSEFKDQVINSHPALLPDFGGHGMYGIHVHKSVLQAKRKTTGITIHYVNEHYDQGSIIAQKKIDVFPEDTPKSLEKRVKEQEKPFYASVIQRILNE